MADPYFSEIKYLGGPTLDFIEVAVDAGTDVTDLVVTIYLSNGNIRSTNLLDGLTPTTISGKDVYVIDTTTTGSFTGLGKTNGLALSDATTVYSFFSFDDLATPITANTGPAAGQTSTQIGQAGAGESLETSDDGATYSVQTTPNSGTIPCFTSGTHILTDAGEVVIDDLEPGAMVASADGSYSELLAVFKRTLSRSELIKSPKMFPVRISANALGAGLPQRDLLVSRQHRMLANSKIVERMFDVTEVLIPAIRLIELPGIFVDTSVQSVTYFHLLFAAHEVICAEGAPSESLFLGDNALSALPSSIKTEINEIFPELVGSSDRITLSRLVPQQEKQKKMVARHVSNQKSLLERNTHFLG